MLLKRTFNIYSISVQQWCCHLLCLSENCSDLLMLFRRSGAEQTAICWNIYLEILDQVTYSLLFLAEKSSKTPKVVRVIIPECG